MAGPSPFDEQNPPPGPNPNGDDDGNPPVGGALVGPDGGSGGADGSGNGRLRVKPDPEIDRAAARLALTDLGNAERFVLRYGADFRFCAEIGWFQWDGMRWRLLSEEKDRAPAAVMQAVFMTVRAIKNEAKLVRDSGVKAGTESEILASGAMDFVVDAKKELYFSDKIAEWARTSESAGKIKCIPDLAKTFASINAAVDDFDRDRMAINCQNGTLRLVQAKARRSSDDVAAGLSEWHMVWTVKLFPHDRGDLITKVTRAAYRPRAKAAVYDAFIARVQPDPVMRRFIHQWGGLSLTGDIGEQKLAFFYGQGRNGKGTWVEAVAHLAGDYAGSLPIESLLENGKKRGDQASPDIARLPGVRFLRVSEPSKGAVLNEGLVKMVTGGDPVDARFLNKGLFTFLPEFKMLISGNQKPRIKDESDGIWRRMQLVPWDVQIPLAEVDKRLTQRLQDEADGIFTRMIEGLIDWRKAGLIEPEAVRAATSAYRDDSDDIGMFLAQCCEVGEDRRDRQWRVRVSDLYALFEAWAGQTGNYVHSSKAFTNAMGRKRFEQKHSNGSWWIGIRPVVEIADVKAGEWTAVTERDGAGNDRSQSGGSGSQDFDRDDGLEGF